MKQWILPCLLVAGAAQAAGWTSRAEWLMYGTQYAVDRGSLFNPDNALMGVPAEIVTGELRPDIAWSDERLTLNLKPRLQVAHSAAGQTHESGFNEANARWRLNDELMFAAGREVLLWGPAQFWNPSNPFAIDNGKANARAEVAGKTFARLRWQAGEGWVLQAISQIDQGQAKDGAKRMDAVKLDWVGSEASASALVAARPGGPLQWHGWAQWTVDDAWLVYGEAAWLRRRVWVPERAATSTGWRVVATPERGALDATLGTSYTFLNGWTVNAEYFRHGGGLSGQNHAAWNDWATALKEQPADGALAAAQRGHSLSPGATPLRRNYLAVQVRNGSEEKTGWNLRYSRNLDDGSGQAVLQLSFDLSDHVQLWANALAHHGSRRTEYGRWLKSSAMLGVTAYLW